MLRKCLCELIDFTSLSLDDSGAQATRQASLVRPHQRWAHTQEMRASSTTVAYLGIRAKIDLSAFLCPSAAVALCR